VAAITVRDAREADLEVIVRWHLAEFPQGFFARLGPGFLRAYYRSFMAAPAAVLWVAADDDTLVGCVAATTDAAAHRRHVLAVHRRRLAVAAGAALLRRPRLAGHFIRSRASRYVRRVLPRILPAARPCPAAPDAGLTVGTAQQVVVAAEARRRGVGRLLLQRVAAHARACGADRLMLVSDRAERSHRFYGRLGWTHDGQKVTHDGRALARWSLDLRGR